MVLYFKTNCFELKQLKASKNPNWVLCPQTSNAIEWHMQIHARKNPKGVKSMNINFHRSHPAKMEQKHVDKLREFVACSSGSKGEGLLAEMNKLMEYLFEHNLACRCSPRTWRVSLTGKGAAALRRELWWVSAGWKISGSSVCAPMKKKSSDGIHSHASKCPACFFMSMCIASVALFVPAAGVISPLWVNMICQNNHWTARLQPIEACPSH